MFLSILMGFRWVGDCCFGQMAASHHVFGTRIGGADVGLWDREKTEVSV